MIFFSTDHMPDRREQKIQDEHIRTTARVFEGYMKYSGIPLNYVGVPKERIFGRRNVALARIAFSVPPEGKSRVEQSYALTTNGLFGRVEPKGGDNPLVAWDFTEKPILLSSALRRRVGDSTVGEIMQANIDAIELRLVCENAGFHFPIATVMEQTPLTVPVPTEVNPLLIAA